MSETTRADMNGNENVGRINKANAVYCELIRGSGLKYSFEMMPSITGVLPQPHTHCKPTHTWRHKHELVKFNISWHLRLILRRESLSLCHLKENERWQRQVALPRVWRKVRSATRKSVTRTRINFDIFDRLMGLVDEILGRTMTMFEWLPPFCR